LTLFPFGRILGESDPEEASMRVHADAEEWIRWRADVTGPIETESEKPWGLVLRVPTSEGTFFYKQPAAEYAHEARVIKQLGRRRPQAVPELVAWDESGRMLMQDAGEQLSAVLDRHRDLRYWEAALPVYAELQLAVAPDADQLLAAGALDRRLALVPDLCHSYIGHATLVSEVTQVCNRLRALGIPETIQNDDLTSANVFLRSGRYRFIDWGFSCVSHPFFTFAVTQRAIERRFSLPPRSREIARVRDAYLEPFASLARRSDLEDMIEPARRIGQICRVALRAESRWKDEQGDLSGTVKLLLDPDAWRAGVP